MPLRMQRKKKTYNVFQRFTSVFLMLTLVWLTISIPYVYSSQLQLAADGVSVGIPLSVTAEEESHNPFGNTTEEKGPGNNSMTEEYLHGNEDTGGFFTATSPMYNCVDWGTYHAFHGELLVPPPNVI